jgi:C-terminal processing protease CtpA/Prc
MPGFTSTAQTAQRAFADQLHAILKQLDAHVSCGWIVDLRRNTGGNVWPMLAGIGPLLGEGNVAAARYADGSRVAMWYRAGQAGLGDFAQLTVSGEPYRSGAATLPVAVLTGEDTASSGEAIAVAFRGRPDARSFGAATRGISTGNRSFPLSDGAALVLTVATTADREGRLYGGAIEPDQAVADQRAGAPLAGQPAVRAALDWLVGQARCARHDAGVPPEPLPAS